MLLFMDGFDHYPTDDIPKKWSSSGSATYNTINTTGGRRGGGAYQNPSNGTGAGIQKPLPASASLVCGMAFKTGEFGGYLARFYDSGTAQIYLTTDTTGHLVVTRAGTAVTGGVSSNTLSLNAWAYIEIKFTVADSIAAGSCKVRVNGVDWITVTAGQDLKATANATVDSVTIGCGSGSYGANSYFDDFYLCDQSGATNNDFLGDCRIDTLYPTTAGNYTQFTSYPSQAERDAPHAYWRLYCANRDNTTLGMWEIEMRATAGGADQCSGGTATSSAGTAANAFDNNTFTYCALENQINSWVAYQFASPVNVKQLMYLPAFKTGPGDVMQLQYSDDGVTYVAVGSLRPLDRHRAKDHHRAHGGRARRFFLDPSGF